jgi:apolipoprotein N-acyltransferase
MSFSKQWLQSPFFRGGLLFLLGASWCLGFAPLSWVYLQPLGLALAIAIARAPSEINAPTKIPIGFKAGFCYGFGQFSVGIHWLYISLHEFGEVPAAVAVLAVALLAAYMALFPAMAFFIMRRLDQRWQGRLEPVTVKAVLFGMVWAVSEYARAWVFTGFPWLTSGEAWLDTPFSGWYPLIGNYGLCFALGFFAFCLASLLSGLRATTGVRARLLILMLPLAFFAGAGQLMVPLSWGAEKAGQVSVHIIQPNVSQTVKFDPQHITENFLSTVDLGRLAGEHSKPGDWLMFPETALPVLWQEAPQSWRDAFAGLAFVYQTPVVMGAALQDGNIYTNSVIALPVTSPNAPDHPSDRYDKRHLVPFGEFIPLGFRWFVDLMNMPMGDFNRGQGAPSAFQVSGLNILPNVCYEDVFSHEFAALVSSATPEPNVLFNVSNLAWFGQSWALEQHAQMSRVRSAEHRKPTVRATNTGVSGVIDANGQWVMSMQSHARLVGKADLVGMKGLTPYARLGLFAPIFFALLVLALAFAVSRPRQVQ